MRERTDRRFRLARSCRPWLSGRQSESRHPDFKPGDEKALYVTTDGGFLIPHESGIQDAKLVRMEVGESGWPLLQGV